MNLAVYGGDRMQGLLIMGIMWGYNKGIILQASKGLVKGSEGINYSQACITP
jgi:hypothetical protein